MAELALGRSRSSNVGNVDARSIDPPEVHSSWIRIPTESDTCESQRGHGENSESLIFAKIRLQIGIYDRTSHAVMLSNEVPATQQNSGTTIDLSVVAIRTELCDTTGLYCDRISALCWLNAADCQSYVPVAKRHQPCAASHSGKFDEQNCQLAGSGLKGSHPFRKKRSRPLVGKRLLLEALEALEDEDRRLHQPRPNIRSPSPGFLHTPGRQHASRAKDWA